ncbi:cytochrome c biogenesis heme-transporting ATPase CcmA [Oceanicoccus sagamiensis]|uniref:Heme ABC transporter ATP-binding protein CcmA n=1 Tax=Oceanicoccus sagamiensis TaxID=716816 RepID=A0A1X9NE69_9GAMM|nr:cytochrome c biogenesis heme-transporting ATPase CcmA [Oceanicoccus sagamiensis]ARN75441.1 heme ABC transporter ATP-binding protein CcmA [Oceanicoccus sagamiensis]
MSPSLPPLLTTDHLCCERDSRVLVDNLNLSIEPGRIYQVEGPNGSGKTTLLRVLCGLSFRYSGEICWQGQPVAKVKSAYHSQLLYLGHNSGVKAALSPRENLQWHAALIGLKAEQATKAIMAALDKVGLYGYEDAACFTLSAGQQRRVGLARLFLGDAALWILDEPFTAIDKQGVAELESWIADYAANGGTVILTTHHELTLDASVQRIRLGGQ